MSETYVIDATARDRAGKGAARAARREGLVPGVIYGDGKEPELFTMEKKDLTKLMHQPGFFTSIGEIELDGKKTRVLARDMQLDPVRDFPTHLDLLRVNQRTKLVIEVPVEFEDEDKSEGLKRGGILSVVRHTIAVRCRAGNMPEALTVSVGHLDINDSVHMSDMNLPEGVTPVEDRNFTIASVTAPSALRRKQADEAAGEEGEEGAEGEAAAESEDA
ncbi:MAG: 50S ribosomal protein L25/general stress protein Ctc [Alphaproteobacteria bacterium]